MIYSINKIKVVIFSLIFLISLMPISSAISFKQINHAAQFILISPLLISQSGGGGNLVTGDNYYREYNELNQLTRVREGNEANGRILEEYFYDANGDRIKVIRTCYTAGCSNETIYTPYKEWMQIRNSSGTYDFNYVYQDGVLVSRLNPDGTKWFYHPDHLGSTSLITDQNGNVVEGEFYSPYGESLSVNDDEKFKLYTGQFKDTTGMYYYGSRYYKPDWAIFTQCDKTKFNVYNPQALNCYSYGLNNPYRYRDDNGNTPWDVVDVGLFALDLQAYQEDPSLSNAISLVVSAVSLAPVIPNVLGYVKYGGKAVDKAADTVRAVDKAGDVTKTADKTADTSKILEKASQEGFTSKELLEEHFIKHGEEFGFESVKQYETAAKNFARSNDKGLQQYVRKSGDIVRYNPKTNEFAVVSKQGTMRTYFKPKEGSKYYKKDRLKYEGGKKNENKIQKKRRR